MAKYKLLYKLTHANGALADETLDTPFEFEIGDGQLDPCLESCIEEAKVGKLQTFLLIVQNFQKTWLLKWTPPLNLKPLLVIPMWAVSTKLMAMKSRLILTTHWQAAMYRFK